MYIEKLTQSELESYFLNYFSLYKNSILSVEVKNNLTDVEVLVYVKNRIFPKRYCYTDYTAEQHWVNFLKNKFGNNYVKNFQKFNLDLLKEDYLTETKVVKEQMKNNKNSYLNKILKNELKSLKQKYEQKNEKILSMVNIVAENEESIEK